MKLFPSQLIYLMRHRPGRRNIRRLLRFFLLLAALVTAYSVLFHFLMAHEGREFTWVTGFYWTLTVMSTLGFGDITFESDVGRVFSMVVLFSGIVFLLVLLPFTFMEFFYAPWMEAQAAARAPREVGRGTRGHVVLVHYDPVTGALIHRLEQYRYPYVLLVPEVSEAVRLHDSGVKVMVGALDDPETYRRCRVDQAALVAATASDPVNTNVASTVRSVSNAVPIVTTATSPASVDILELAGSTHVLRIDETMGQSLARRTNGGDNIAHVVGRFDDLLIAEATAAGTPLVGKTLRETKLRETVGISVVGVWERGRFERAEAETRISSSTVLVLAGSRDQLDAYDEFFCIYYAVPDPVVIVGGGRIGGATARALAAREINYRMVERDPAVIDRSEKWVLGDAAELETLKQAGIMKSPTVVVTTNDDDVNIYLTIYCRRLRPDIQIISRATLERNALTLHRAGADFVMSYASMGANMIFNLLRRSDVVMVAEGLDVFRLRVPPALARKTIAASGIRQRSGCTVIAVNANSAMRINPDPGDPLPPEGEMILIGTAEEENQFLRLFGHA
jgi:Trk K+ transport system NAD-binding subunit